MPDIRGDGEYIMRISRFIPDFISQTGTLQLNLKQDYIQTVVRLLQVLLVTLLQLKKM